jgi:hypothetical protein
MSAKPPALVYNDAEKGTLDARSPQIADLAKSEKKAADIDVFPVQSLKKDAPVTPSDVAKPPPAPAKPAKKRAPLWVLWVIWYNSYRYMIFRLQEYLEYSSTLFHKGVSLLLYSSSTSLDSALRSLVNGHTPHNILVLWPSVT